MAEDTDGEDGATAMMICLMRHGVRLDDKNPDAAWSDKAGRPYDTPLAGDAESNSIHRESVTAAFAAVCSHCANRNPTTASATTIILSSPYRRCLQTAGMVARCFKIDRIYVDNRLGESLEAVKILLKRKRKVEGNGADSDAQALTYLSFEEAEDAAGDGVTVVWDREANAMLRLDIVDDVAARAQQISSVVAEQCAAAAAAPYVLAADGVAATVPGDMFTAASVAVGVGAAKDDTGTAVGAVAGAAGDDAAAAAAADADVTSGDSDVRGNSAAAAPVAARTAVVITHGDVCNAFSSPSAIVPDIGQFRFDYIGWVLQAGLQRPPPATTPVAMHNVEQIL